MTRTSEPEVSEDRDMAIPGLARLWQQGVRVRRRMVRLVWLEGTLWVLGSVVLAVVLGLIADWWLDLSVGWRRAAWIVYFGVAVAAFRRWVLVPWRRIPSGDRLALFLERQEPSLRSRVISAVQLARSMPPKGTADAGTPAAFVRRLVGEADRTVAGLDRGRLVSSEGLRRAARRIGLLLFLVAGVAFWGGATRDILLRRLVGQEVSLPRQTRILEVTGARVVGRGDDLTVIAKVGGVMPKTGRLLVRHASGRDQTLVMEADAAGSGHYERLLPNLTSDFRYRVRIHDAESPEFVVEVLPRPVVTNLLITLTYPAYTKLAPRLLPPGELTLLRGGRLRLEATASQDLDRAEVLMEGISTQVVARVDPAHRDRFVAEWPVEEPSWTGFSIRLSDTRGITSADPAVYAVSVVEDQPPSVRMILPSRREELVTAHGSILVSFEAKDDFGVAGLRLMHQPAASTNLAVEPSAVELELGEDASTAVRRRFEWKLSDIRPPVAEGAFLEFWVEAVDRRVDGGPGVGKSERYLARVVSEAEKRSDLLTRAGDAIGRLGDVAQGQERLNESLGRIILEKATPRKSTP